MLHIIDTNEVLSFFVDKYIFFFFTLSTNSKSIFRLVLRYNCFSRKNQQRSE